MAIGDVVQADWIDADLWYVDTGMYGVEEYGSVYLLDGERPALVDSGIGTNRERVVAMCERAGLDVRDLAVIALTHVHLDHAGGAGFLAERADAEVYVHEVGAPHLVDPERLWDGTKWAVRDQIRWYVEPEPIPESRITTLTDGDAVDLGDRELLAHHVPGHAPHQVAFEAPWMDAVFPGDSAGLYTPSTDELHATTPPPNFDREQALADVETLQALDPATICYAHFGPAPAADRLDTYASVLDDWVDAVGEKRAKLDGDDAVVAHFVETMDVPEAWGEEKGPAEVGLNVRGVLHALEHGQA